MLRIIAALLTLCFVWTASFNTAMYLRFMQDQAYYAAELCEQKEIQANTCQGKCQLKAILLGEDLKEPLSPISPDYKEERSDIFIHDLVELDAILLDQIVFQEFQTRPDRIAEGYLVSDWKPPQV